LIGVLIQQAIPKSAEDGYTYTYTVYVMNRIQEEEQPPYQTEQIKSALG